MTSNGYNCGVGVHLPAPRGEGVLIRIWRALVAVAGVLCCSLSGTQPAPEVGAGPGTPSIRVAPVAPGVVTKCVNGTVILRPSPEAVEACVRGMGGASATPALKIPADSRSADPRRHLWFDLHPQPYPPPRVLPPRPQEWLWPSEPTRRFFTDPRSILQPRQGWPGLKLEVPDAVTPEKAE